MAFTDLKTEFASLNDVDFDGQWTNVSLADLNPIEQQQIRMFHSLVAPEGQDLDESNVLLVQAENGFLKDIYAASLRKSEDETGLVIKLGSNVYPATIEASERKVGSRILTEYVIACGQLFASVDFADKESEASVKIGNVLTKVSYVRCWVDLCDASKANEFHIPLTLDLTQQPSKQKVLTSIQNNTLYTLLKPATGSSNSSEAKPMVELGEGLFKVIGIRTVPTEKYGDRFILDINEHGEVWIRGGADKQLTADKAKYEAAVETETLWLAVGNIKHKEDERGNKKTYLDSALRIKSGEVAPLPASVPVTPVVPEPSYDEIPF